MTVFTIGHSNHSLDTLVGLLQEHEVKTVVDVRSAPYSRYSPHFAREHLEAALPERDLRYAYAGKYLGGRPADPSCYKAGTLPPGDADYLREVDYPAIMTRDWFIRGMDRLLELAMEGTTAVMCSEENPAHCHRHHLIARYLMARHPEVSVRHIRGTGLLLEAAAIPALIEKPLVIQGSLF
ncbi:MAG TPA: DUF488 domain-containing protein [Chloroflexota bacterium]|nr:DUF488 domain-containing protein [Chloroflexota bacterium]